MIKSATLYRLVLPAAISLEEIDVALQAARFTPCGATQEKATGWVPPRGEDNGALVESIAGWRVLRFLVETKGVPASAVRQYAETAADEIEAEIGRRPGKREMRELRESALLALLPQAFPRQAGVSVLIEPANGWLIADANSQALADTIISALVQAMPSAVMRLVNTRQTPQSAMAQWLSEGEAVGAFQLEHACELKSSAEDRAVVKYNRHTLDTDEIKKHIAQGKLPTRVALNWQGRVAFTLTDTMRLKGLGFLKTVFEGTSKEQQDSFDADLAITTGELGQLLPALIEALGGELVEGAQP